MIVRTSIVSLPENPVSDPHLDQHEPITLPIKGVNFHVRDQSLVGWKVEASFSTPIPTPTQNSGETPTDEKSILLNQAMAHLPSSHCLAGQNLILCRPNADVSKHEAFIPVQAEDPNATLPEEQVTLTRENGDPVTATLRFKPAIIARMRVSAEVMAEAETNAEITSRIYAALDHTFKTYNTAMDPDGVTVSAAMLPVSLRDMVKGRLNICKDQIDPPLSPEQATEQRILALIEERLGVDNPSGDGGSVKPLFRRIEPRNRATVIEPKGGKSESETAPPPEDGAKDSSPVQRRRSPRNTGQDGPTGRT